MARIMPVVTRDAYITTAEIKYEVLLEFLSQEWLNGEDRTRQLWFKPRRKSRKSRKMEKPASPSKENCGLGRGELDCLSYSIEHKPFIGLGYIMESSVKRIVQNGYELVVAVIFIFATYLFNNGIPINQNGVVIRTIFNSITSQYSRDFLYVFIFHGITVTEILRKVKG